MPDTGTKRTQGIQRLIMLAGFAAFSFNSAGMHLHEGGAAQSAKARHSRTAATQKSDDANPFSVQFHDVTKQAGIHFHHERAASDQKLYLETMGAGVAWIDYNRDCFLDAFFVNNGDTPFFHPEQPPQPALYRNNGAGPFTDDTQQAGIRPDGTFFFGVAVAAFDIDSYPDIYLTGSRQPVMYYNNRHG